MSVEPSTDSPTLDHLGIAVESLDTALPLWRDVLGLPFLGIEEVPSEGVRVAMLQVGDTRIELLEPLHDESPIAKYLAKRGGGIHHVAVKVSDIDASGKSLATAGRPPLEETPRDGAGGARVHFVHPKHTGGVLLELTSGHGSELGGDSHGDESS